MSTAIQKRKEFLEERQSYLGASEKCAAWLAEFCGIVVIPPELFFEGK